MRICVKQVLLNMLHLIEFVLFRKKIIAYNIQIWSKTRAERAGSSSSIIGVISTLSFSDSWRTPSHSLSCWPKVWPPETFRECPRCLILPRSVQILGVSMTSPLKEWFRKWKRRLYTILSLKGVVLYLFWGILKE